MFQIGLIMENDTGKRLTQGEKDFLLRPGVVADV
jgi:hypothetical protein